MGVSSLTVFQRTPCWSPPRLDYAYPPAIKTLFDLVPFTNTVYRSADLVVAIKINNIEQFIRAMKYLVARSPNSFEMCQFTSLYIGNFRFR